MLYMGTSRLGDSKGLAQEPGCVSEKNKAKQSKNNAFESALRAAKYEVRKGILANPSIAKQLPCPRAMLDAGVCSHQALKGTRCAEGVGSDAAGHRGRVAPLEGRDQRAFSRRHTSCLITRSSWLLIRKMGGGVQGRGAAQAWLQHIHDSGLPIPWAAACRGDWEQGSAPGSGLGSMDGGSEVSPLPP